MSSKFSFCLDVRDFEPVRPDRILKAPPLEDAYPAMFLMLGLFIESPVLSAGDFEPCLKLGAPPPKMDPIFIMDLKGESILRPVATLCVSNLL